MAGCPLRNFEECPEHNKKGGCEWWLGYASNSDSSDARLEGCAVVLLPFLQVEHANALGTIAGEVRRVSSEVSAERCENIKEGAALRQQLFFMAGGERVLVNPEHGGEALPQSQPGALEDKPAS